MNNTRLIGIVLIVALFVAIILAIWFGVQAGNARREAEEARARGAELEARVVELEAQAADQEARAAGLEARATALEEERLGLEARLEEALPVAVAPGQLEYALVELPAGTRSVMIAVTTEDERTASTVFETREAIEDLILTVIGEEVPETPEEPAPVPEEPVEPEPAPEAEAAPTDEELEPAPETETVPEDEELEEEAN